MNAAVMDMIDNMRKYVNGGTLLLAWFLVINLIAFCSMGRDKRRARNGEWRIPEATLFLQALLGGSIGSILGMAFFHHKTRKLKFRIGMPLILLVQVLCVLALLSLSDGVSFR